jgi:hypothetical protein
MIIIPLQVGIKGFWKAESVRPSDGRRTLLADWFPNTILDSGRNAMATEAVWAGQGAWCHVGTDNRTPVVTDTQLYGHVQSTNETQSNLKGNQATPPYYGWDRTTYRFPVGPIGGQNLSEVGVGWTDTLTGQYLITRSLIVGPGGQPSITPLPDEYLDMTYELRYYPPENDIILNDVSVNGLLYNTITRASDVTSALATNIGRAIGQLSDFSADWSAFDDDIGAVTEAPNGVQYQCDNANQFNLAYSNNSYQIDVGSNCGSTGWNAITGKLLRSLRIKTTAGNFQTQFDAQGNPGFGIPKTDQFTMSCLYRVSWVEKVLP